MVFRTIVNAISSITEEVERVTQSVDLNTDTINNQVSEITQNIQDELQPYITRVNNSHPPTDYSDIFEFNNEITLEEFLLNFDDGIKKFNQKINIYNTKNKEFNELHDKINKNIKDRQKSETINRGNLLLSQKIDFYDSWIKYTYRLLRINIIVLSVIVIISLVYKLI